MSEIVMEGFSSIVAAAVAGASIRQVQYWDQTGLIPAVVPASGRGKARRWSFTNLMQLRTVGHLRDLGVSLQACRKVAEHLAKDGESFSSRKLLVRDGEEPDVLTLESDELALSRLEQPGQIVTRLCVVDLEARAIEVRERLKSAVAEEKRNAKPRGRKPARKAA
jgi:DNA-binding transcriptional MerR regulator